MEFFKKVWKNKSSGQKMITIPAKENIDEGEWVMVKKINPKNFYPKPGLPRILKQNGGNDGKTKA